MTTSDDHRGHHGLPARPPEAGVWGAPSPSPLPPPPPGPWQQPTPAGAGWALGLSIVAILISVGAALGAGAAVLASLDGSGLFEDWTVVEPEGAAAALDGLDVGGCFTVVMGEPETVEGVDCGVPHDGEVYLVTPMTGYSGTYPGRDEVGWAADDECFPAFEDYVGEAYDTSDYDYAVYAPDEQAWSRGDRSIACVIRPYRLGSLVGSARDGAG